MLIIRSIIYLFIDCFSLQIVQFDHCTKFIHIVNKALRNVEAS